MSLVLCQPWVTTACLLTWQLFNIVVSPQGAEMRFDSSLMLGSTVVESQIRLSTYLGMSIVVLVGLLYTVICGGDSISYISQATFVFKIYSLTTLCESNYDTG